MKHKFRRRRLEHSLSIATSLMVIVVIGATMLVVHTRLSQGLRSGLESEASSIAKSIGAVATPSLLAYNYPALQMASERSANEPDIHYVIIHDKEHKIAGVSGTTFEDGVPRDVGSLGEAGVFTLEQNPANGQAHPILESVVPVYVEGSASPWGWVRVGLCFSPVETELSRLRWGLLLLGALLTILALAGSRAAAGRITAPLRRLAEGTEALAWGDTSRRIPLSGSRELAELAQAFNRMLDRVEEKASESTAYQEALARLNATLEEQVLERTRALEESELQYRSLVDCSPNAIAILQDQQLRFVNRSFEETFGLQAGEAINDPSTLDQIFEAESAQVVRERIRDWERGKDAGPATVAATSAEGTRLELELRGSQIEYKGERAAECILVDMTEAIRLREQLEGTERLRSLGELASGVAHDFNNLLGAILGRAQMMRQRGCDSESDRDLAVIEQAAQDGRETVRRIQEFSRHKSDLPNEEVNLGGLLQDSIEITRTRWKTEAERRNVRIELDLDLQPVEPILGKPAELREVFTNLIINATDAMPQGGVLSVRCGSEEGFVYVELKDTGVGMTEDTRRHLFDPFFTTKGLSGTGLGMSVAYGIVARHQGTIDVKSEVGIGTLFRLRFPVELSNEEKSTPSLPSVEKPCVQASRILVIDDERPIAQLLDDALSIDGHEVEMAFSGAEGVELATKARYDLVLTDLGMPDMSGWEVAERIHELHPDVPVLLVTGWAATIGEQEIAASHVTALVHKPFEIRELLATAAAAIAAGSAQKPQEQASEPLPTQPT